MLSDEYKLGRLCLWFTSFTPYPFGLNGSLQLVPEVLSTPAIVRATNIAESYIYRSHILVYYRVNLTK